MVSIDDFKVAFCLIFCKLFSRDPVRNRSILCDSKWQKHPVSCKEEPRVVFIRYDSEMEIPNGVAPTGFQGACERGTKRLDILHTHKKKDHNLISFNV